MSNDAVPDNRISATPSPFGGIASSGIGSSKDSKGVTTNLPCHINTKHQTFVASSLIACRLNGSMAEISMVNENRKMRQTIEGRRKEKRTRLKLPSTEWRRECKTTRMPDAEALGTGTSQSQNRKLRDSPSDLTKV